MVATMVTLGGIAVEPAAACTVIAVGRDATIDGSVIVSHTDAGPNSRIHVVHGQTHASGQVAPVHWGITETGRPVDDFGEVLGSIPQVERTLTYFHSAYPHLNERQLAIGESTTVQRPELELEQGEGEQIMTIEQAQVFALQRATKAREAVELIGDLMVRYGFLPSSGKGSEALVIGDPGEVWVFEVFSVGPGWTRASGRPGAIWAAQRLPDDHACMIPNWSIIKEIDPEDTARFLVSENYMQEAIDRGWYDPSSGRPFVWQEAYAPLPLEFATSRFWLFHHTFAPAAGPWADRSLKDDPGQTLNQYYQYVEPLSLYPFSVAPERKISIQDVMTFQRSTFENTIYDITAQPQWLVPDGEGGMVTSPLATPFPNSDLRTLLRLTNRRPVARHRGHYGMVTQLRDWLPDAIGGVYWVYLDNPYVSPYVPIYAGVREIGPSYQIYDPEVYDEGSARWAVDFVDNLAGLRFQDAMADVRAERDPFESGLFADQATVEAEAVRLHADSPQAARDYLTRNTQAAMTEVLEMYTRLRGTLISKYTNNRE
ncbi:MAG: peptidase [bacterium]|nr:peptidase [bacterium]